MITACIRGFLIVLVGLSLGACSSVQYYAQAVRGHTELLSQEEPIEEVLERKDLSPELIAALAQSQEARDFAVSELGLPDNDSYRNFVHLDRDFVVWNVVSTKEFSLEPEKWCFLVVGCISYKGYFDKKEADGFAERLRQLGNDVSVSGVRAYSTIGWFDDPLLSTMLYKNEARRMGIIFHELAHQQLYIKGDSAFNEAFAMTVEIEGVRRWLRSRNQHEQLKAYEVSLDRKWIFNRLLNETREALKSLYSQPMSVEEMRLQKARVFEVLRRDYKQAREAWGGYDGYDDWMARDLNNAHLSLVATYYDLIPAFQGLLADSQQDFRLFYDRAARIGEKDKDKRSAELARYSQLWLSQSSTQTHQNSGLPSE
jgi:predicted aminopeptidase